jgi:hypothetical protein
MVMYSDTLARGQVSHTASLTRSIPRTKIRAATSNTAEERIHTGPYQLILQRPSEGRELTDIGYRSSPYEKKTGSGEGEEKSSVSSGASDPIEEKSVDISKVVARNAAGHHFRRTLNERQSINMPLNLPQGSRQQVTNAVACQLHIQIHLVFAQ